MNKIIRLNQYDDLSTNYIKCQEGYNGITGCPIYNQTGYFILENGYNTLKSELDILMDEYVDYFMKDSSKERMVI